MRKMTDEEKEIFEEKSRDIKGRPERIQRMKQRVANFLGVIWEDTYPQKEASDEEMA